MNCELEEVRAAVAASDFDGQAAQLRMAPSSRPGGRARDLPGSPRRAAVLLLLYCLDDRLTLVLTRRPDYDGVHSGQVSCPGGQHEAPETLETTALRETFEEIGVAPDDVEVIGRLTPLYIPPSDFEVHPFVGVFRNGRPRFTPDTFEVAEVIETPLDVLLDPVTRQEELWELRGMSVSVPYFLVSGHKVWGATAMILSEFVERLRAQQKDRAPRQELGL